MQISNFAQKGGKLNFWNFFPVQVADVGPDEEAVPGRVRHGRDPHPPIDVCDHRPPPHLLLLRHHWHGVLPRSRIEKLLSVSNFLGR